MNAIAEQVETLTARLWTPEDTEQLVGWFEADPTLWQFVPGLEHQLDSDELRAHGRLRATQQDAGEALVVAVERNGRLACQCTIYPRRGQEGACHFLVARWTKGHGVTLIRAALAEAQRHGVKKIIGIPSPLLPQDTYIRFMRRVGFTIKFYGEIVHV